MYEFIETLVATLFVIIVLASLVVFGLMVASQETNDDLSEPSKMEMRIPG